MMPDETSMLRQWKLIRMLCARRYGLTIREMAAEMKVGERTIRRDLKMFRSVGFRLEETTGDRGCKTWQMAGDQGNPPMTFTFEEAAALSMGRQFLEPLAGTPFWSAAQRAWGKVRASLGKSVADYLDRFPKMFHCTTFGHADYTDKAGILEDLTIAIEDHRAVHLTYQSQQATEPMTRDVYPLGWRCHRDALYLIAAEPGLDRPKTYKVARMDAVEVSAFVHQLYRDFDIEAFNSGSFGIYDGDDDITVVVKFLPAVARYVSEKRWHKSQEETKHRDGSLTVRYRLSNTVEIKSWILGFGANAIVLEPESLREEIAAELEQMLKAYRGMPPKAAPDAPPMKRAELTKHARKGDE
jgi:predicted DNA-binding transcriptional regulator YafY